MWKQWFDDLQRSVEEESDNTEAEHTRELPSAELIRRVKVISSMKDIIAGTKHCAGALGA